MVLRRLTLCLAALCLSPLLLGAEALQDSHGYCEPKQAATIPPCHLQPCPCGPQEETLRKFEDTTGSAPLCACRSPLVLRYQTRQQAVAACDDYRRSRRQSCFISRGDCPPGFAALAEFTDTAGNRFTACKDDRHQQPRPANQGFYGLSQSELLQQYERLVARFDRQRVAEPEPLPRPTIDRLAPYFPAFSLEGVSLTRTEALREGCFNDCERIYCAADAPVAPWLDAQRPLVSKQLLHLIVHVESCHLTGGRQRFIARWFRHLPDDAAQQMQAGEPIAAGRLHYSMYMEKHAERRAESLCRQLPACRLQETVMTKEGSSATY